MGAITRAFANQIKTGGKLDADGLDLTDTFAFTGTVTGAGGVNTPVFEAYVSSGQTITSAVETKVQFNTERFDTNSVYDNATNYRFTIPSGQDGKYFIYSIIKPFNSNNDSHYSNLLVKLNGSTFFSQSFDFTGSTILRQSNHTYTGIINLVENDYIEIYGQTNGTGTISILSGSYFGAFKIVE